MMKVIWRWPVAPVTSINRMRWMDSIRKRQVADLFHPRRHPWQEHFRFDEETGSLLGLTPTGRATVARLQMNTPFQAAARLIWIRLGIYP